MPWVTLGLWILISSWAVDKATSFSSRDQVFSFMHSMLSLTRSLWWTSTAAEVSQARYCSVFSFKKKIIDLLGGQINDPHREIILPSHSLVSVSDPWRAFRAYSEPFKGLRFASCIGFGTKEKNKDTVRCVALGAEVPEHHKKTTDANFDCALFVNTLVKRI